MRFQPDMHYFLDCFRRIVERPRPVGGYRVLNPVLEQEATYLENTVNLLPAYVLDI